MSSAGTRSDVLLRELFLSRAANPALIESILVLAFLPMLHGTIRRVGRQQPALAREDIAQQALSFLLQYLRSAELEARRSHFAFVISRAVKRQVFAWANRESEKTRLLRYYDSETHAVLTTEKPFERYALLRHFLHRCVTKGLLDDAELDLLIEFKLNGTSGEEFADFKMKIRSRRNVSFSWSQAERIAKHIRIMDGLGDGRREQYATLILLAAASGLRSSELLALKVEDINFKACTVRVDESSDQRNNGKIGPCKNAAAYRTIALHDSEGRKSMRKLKHLLAGRPKALDLPQGVCTHFGGDATGGGSWPASIPLLSVSRWDTVPIA